MITVLKIPVVKAMKGGGLVTFFASILITFALQIPYLVSLLKDDPAFWRPLGMSFFNLLVMPFLALAICTVLSALIAIVYNYVARTWGGIDFVLSESPKWEVLIEIAWRPLCTSIFLRQPISCVKQAPIRLRGIKQLTLKVISERKNLQLRCSSD